MVYLGNQTACWAARLTEPFEHALASGFDAFEWFPDKKPGAGWDDSDLGEEQRQAIRETAHTHGVRLSVHARWQANPLQSDSRALLWKDFELACDLGATLLNLHLYHEEGLETYLDAILPLVRQTGESGLQLAIENTPHHGPEQFNELFARLWRREEARLGHVGMCLDLGHANLCAATRNDYLRFLDQLDAQVPIIHLHLHENWGDADTHLPLFTGPAGRDDSGMQGLVERLGKRCFSGSIILEQWPHPPALLNQARDRMLDLIARHAPGLREPGGAPPTPDRPGKRRPAVPSPASDGAFLEVLVAADKRCRSWREKLDFVHSLFLPGKAPLTTEQLADIAIYLRFLSTGQIPCAEDGRHFRPSHHARMAFHIQQRLARLTTPETAFIIRRIHPWLPSSGQRFQRAEPLTRIRDIAHRNDIPSELKREIKQTLQNKLHRCAGPEDLLTSAALLERITAPGGDYAPAFVEQFRVFHEELKEFFNARSLEERLRALRAQAGETEAGLIEAFLSARAGVSLAQRLGALEILTRLRQCFLKVDAGDTNPATQETVMADIGLEDFAFVLLSEIGGRLEAAPPDSWEPLLATLQLTITNLGLSQIEPEECLAIANELRAWRRDFDSSDRGQLLRLKATADRGRRLAEGFSLRILAQFPSRAARLGPALGVTEEAIRVFSEAEIRSHVIFQLSKLVAMVLGRLREQLALPAWDVVVSGRAVGRLQVADTMAELGQDFSRPAVVLLSQAEGDEELPQGVTGLVLTHGIPHLSHLGVRARQAGVVLVACTEVAKLRELQTLRGQMIALAATAEQVTWDMPPGLAASTPPPRFMRMPGVQLRFDRPWVALEQVSPENAGGKANGARRLAELAQRREAEFRAPPGLVVPFGVMEAALRATPEAEAEYRRWLNRINELEPVEFKAATDRLRDVIGRLSVPSEIASQAAMKFGEHARLMVRSSANCEDAASLAGAGLYQSVTNVAVAELCAAVRTVWCSLWTQRAALSRQQAGIPHEQAHMAVLIQPMLVPDYSFVLHTVNPIHGHRQEVYAEIAVGLGETLASAAQRGNPYRLVGDKTSGTVTTLALASFSRALRPQAGGGLVRETVDYSRLELSRDSQTRLTLGRRLTAIGRFVEEAFQMPQDIEGAVVGNEIHLVQARPQQGLGEPAQP
jgi:phosphoglucan, water dikinase